MRFLRKMRLAAALWVALAVAWAPAEGVAELAKWDQDRAEKISGNLATAAHELYTAMRQMPPPTLGTGQNAAWYRALDRVRLIRSESKHLAAALKDGNAYDETLPVWRRLMSLVRDAREEGRKLFLAEPIMDKIAATRDQLRQLAPYYDPKALAGS